MKTRIEKQPNIIALAMSSVWSYLKLALNGHLHLRRGRVGHRYAIEDGRVYSIFRETVSTAANAHPTVLVVGFKLHWIGAKRGWHWLFQRICILTTPFWSGFRGFRVKLWMVAPSSGHYLGIYDWDGPAHAERYVKALERVLRPLSLAGSVWYQLHPGELLDAYLMERDLSLCLVGKEGSRAHAVV